MEDRYYGSQRLRLHYVVWSERSKPPLLLVHGGRDHARSWDRMAEGLTDAFDVYAVDLRGHGDSDWATGGLYLVPDFVLDVSVLAEEIGRPLNVAGHSLGGVIALHYAAIFPERIEKLVVVEGLDSRLERPKPLVDRLRWWVEDTRRFDGREPRRYRRIEDAVERMMEVNPRLTREIAEHLTVHGMRRDEDGGYTWKFDNYERIRHPWAYTIEDARAVWREVRCPTLLVRGGESGASDPEAGGNLSCFHDARSVTIPGAGHWVQHDRPAELLQAIRGFLVETSR